MPMGRPKKVAVEVVGASVEGTVVFLSLTVWQCMVVVEATQLLPLKDGSAGAVGQSHSDVLVHSDRAPLGNKRGRGHQLLATLWQVQDVVALDAAASVEALNGHVRFCSKVM